MSWTTWIGLATGIVMVVGSKLQPPPVVLDLGPVVPTPVSTPPRAQKKRLITTITVQNNVEGETLVSFEATDVADEGPGKTHVIASKTYSFAEQKADVKALSEKIVQQIRQMEHDMLEYAERAGPPKERPPIGSGDSGGSGAVRK